MKTLPHLKTKRLILKGIEEQDTEIIVRLRSDSAIYKYFLFPHKLTAEEHLKWFRENYLYNYDRFDWVASNEQNVIGVFGVKKSSTEVEISYLLGTEFYGKGYASEAVNKIIEFCKESLGINTMIANVHRQNIASRKFIERLGFSKRNETKDFICYEKKLCNFL